jgi:hypothetical protein
VPQRLAILEKAAGRNAHEISIYNVATRAEVCKDEQLLKLDCTQDLLLSLVLSHFQSQQSHTLYNKLIIVQKLVFFT